MAKGETVLEGYYLTKDVPTKVSHRERDEWFWLRCTRCGALTHQRGTNLDEYWGKSHFVEIWTANLATHRPCGGKWILA
jgi:hypothetical protein